MLQVSEADLIEELGLARRELAEALERQAATDEMLRVIASSPGELAPVFQAILANGTRLCEAKFGILYLYQNGEFPIAATHNVPPAFADARRRRPLRSIPGGNVSEAIKTKRPVQLVDLAATRAYAEGHAATVEAVELGGIRTHLTVPMFKNDVAIGAINIYRQEVRPFTDKQIALVTNFADQAVIAIENARLFDEIQDKSRQLAEASQHKSQFLANMSHELRTPLNAILGYTELMADGAYGEPSEKMLGILKRLEANGKHLLGLINDVLDLSKIEAGQLVLELSDYSVQDIAQTVRSTLEPLAADKKLAFKIEVPPQLPFGRGDGRRLTQVLINLVGNAIKFTDAGEVAIKAEANNGSFHVSVRDTGPGISAADQAKLFQEFQQADNAITKKKGGTGLGLAISKRIIEMHGGRIWVESQPGQGSTFAFTLPVTVERQVGTA
jgi:signal transduction histidine kinase